MPKLCSICTHRSRRTIDNCLLRGEVQRAVAKRYHVSEDAVTRHKKHMASAIRTAAQQRVQYGDDLLEQLDAIRADVEAMQAAATASRDVALGLKAARERARLLELQGRLSGAIRNESKSLTVHQHQTNIAISPAEAEEVRRKLFVRFGLEPTVEAKP